MSVTEEQFITADECERILEQLSAVGDHCTMRGDGFLTLGAARYLDDAHTYYHLARDTRAVMLSRFQSLYDHLCNWFDAELTFRAALPGFHIFNHAAAGQTASIHTDEHHHTIPWHSRAVAQTSFTVPLQLPKAGGGLVMYNADGTARETIEYTIGRIYTHDGATPHQIDSTRPMGKGDWRITLQGHCVELRDGTRFLFF